MIKWLEVFNQFVKNFKNIAILVFIIIAGFFAYNWYTDSQENKRLHNDLINQQEEYEQLNENVAKLKNSYQIQSELIERQNKEWAEIEKEKNERIKLLSDATYLIGKHVGRQNGPDYYYETKRKTRNYVLNELRFDGPDSPAIGYIMIKNDGRTYKRNYGFEIQVKNLQTVDEETGRIKIYSKAFMIPKEKSPLAKRIDGYKNWKDIPYPLKIVGGETFVDPTLPSKDKPRFFFWNPKFGASMNMALDKEDFYILPALDVSFMGYGITKNDSKFKFLNVGVSLGTREDEFDLHFKPILWRPLELFSNTYVGAGIGYGINGTRFLLGVSLEF